MQLSDNILSNVVSSSSSKDKQILSTRKSSFKQSSFNQSTLFSLNGSSFLDHQLGKKNKTRNEATSVTFVDGSFLSSTGKCEKGKTSIDTQNQNVKTNNPKKKSKYNFMKKIVAVSKKKFKNAKKFILNIGNKKGNNKHKSSWNQSDMEAPKKK